MENMYWHFLLIYVGFLLLAILLTTARRWLRPNSKPSDIWKKYPVYLFLNFSFICAILLPYQLHTLGFLLATIGYFASREFATALKLSAKQNSRWLSLVAAGFIFIADFFRPPIFIGICATLLLILIAINSLAYHGENIVKLIANLAASLLFLPCTLATLIWIWKTNMGQFNALFVYGVVATNDAFAQIIGQIIGNKLLAPRISPSKTIEGAVGGLLLASSIGASLFSAIGLDYMQGALVAAFISLAGLIGDLMFSSLKRALGLKDFSDFLGPHGGVLDRFDSLIFAAPVFFILWVR
jgi:predicted CDP-diglyceride synthetase/phosphatidate cytidylyltransferase